MSTMPHAKFLLGVLLVADGLPFLFSPRSQAARWATSTTPRWYQRMMGFFGKHRVLTCTLAGAELAAGVGLLRTSIKTT